MVDKDETQLNKALSYYSNYVTAVNPLIDLTNQVDNSFYIDKNNIPVMNTVDITSRSYTDLYN